MIQEHAKAVDVGRFAGGRTIEDLRCDVQRRSREVRQSRARIAVDFASGPEVHQHDAATLLADDVVGLHVPVEEARGVQRRKRTTQIDADGRGFARAERAARVQQLLERLAAQQLHPEADAPFVHVDAVHRDHVGMAHARQQPPLAGDARGLGVVAPACAAKELQRDLAFELAVPCAVDLAVGAATQPLEQRDLRQLREDAQLPDERLVFRGGLACGCLPIDRRTIGDRLGERKQRFMHRRPPFRGRDA